MIAYTIRGVIARSKMVRRWVTKLNLVMVNRMSRTGVNYQLMRNLWRHKGKGFVRVLLILKIDVFAYTINDYLLQNKEVYLL